MQSREGGKELAEKIKPYMTTESYDNFLHGERYIQSPHLVEKFVKALPITDIPEKYVVFKPLDKIDPQRRKAAGGHFLCQSRSALRADRFWLITDAGIMKM